MNFKETFIIIFLLFLASALVMPFAMANCGMNGFHLGLSATNNVCGSGIDIAHLTFMRSFIVIGLIVSIFILSLFIFNQKLFSFVNQLKNQFYYNFNYLLKKQFSLGRMKPFDSLLLAYSSGLIQSKTLCQA